MHGVRTYALILLIAGWAPIAATRAADGTSRKTQVKQLVRVDVSTPDAITALKKVLRAWDVAGSVDAGRSLDLIVTGEQRQRLEAAGVPFKLVIEDIEQRAAGLRASYRSFPQLEADLASMAAAYPNITQLTSIGQSWEGRDLWCIEISDNPGVDEGEVGVVFMGVHHAREWPGLEVAYDIASRLTSGYGSDSTITDLVNNHRIWIIPCVNPDGYVYSHDMGHDWRKNRHPYPGGVGVDLNRNYAGSNDGEAAGEWGSIGNGSQTHQAALETYVGPAPFSEPETQVIRDFFNARDVTISVSYHTYGELVLWPWGHTTALAPDAALLTSLGQGMAAVMASESGFGTYTPQQSVGLYPTTGDSDDWIYGHRYYTLGKNTAAYTVEIGQEFQPPTSNLQQIIDENWDGALYMLQNADSAESQMAPYVLPPLLNAPTVDADGDYSLQWTQKNPDAAADQYALQEFTGLTRSTDGAESGTGNWVTDQFSATASRHYAGSYSFAPPSSTNELIASMTTAQPLPVETGDNLSFWTWYDIEADWDMAFVEVSIDGRKYDVLDKFTGSSGAWVQKSYSLDAYAGHSIYIRFRYTTDEAVTYEGFFVDEVAPVASWANVTTLSSSIPTTSYDVTGRADGDYYYRVKGSNVARGFGDYADLHRVRVYGQLADADADGDKDLRDFAEYQVCFGGDNQPPAAGCPVSVDVFDFDLDEDIDLADLDVLVQCLSGPGGGAPAGCPF